MIPILYASSETSFTSNGIGRLADCISCQVTEERNGIYECEFEYPITGKWYDQLISGGIIGVWHDDVHDLQPFDIYKWSAPLDGIVTFNAHHISYRLGNIILRPFSASSVAEAFVRIPLNSANSNPFTFWTDKTATGSFEIVRPDNVRAVLGGQEGSLLDVYGKGEYEFDKFTVRLYLNRGADKGVTIRYGKNLSDITSTTDASGIYNAIAPYWIGSSGDEDVAVYLPEIYVQSPAVTGAAIPVVMDMSQEFVDQPTEADLRQRALDFLAANEPWNAYENITISFTQLWQTAEYENVAALQRLSLCDKVGIYYPALGVVDSEAEVIKTVYNVLLERYDSMEVGNPQATLAETIADSLQQQMSALAQLINGKVNESFMEAAIENATNLITGGLGGNVVFGFNAQGKPEEILIMNTDSIQTATRVIRMNQNGIGFSTTGYAGPYTTAWTIDGNFVADFITSGTLSANVLRAGIITDATGYNYWNLDTGEFRLASTVKIGTGDRTIAGAIMDVDVEYARNQSNTTAPTTGWSTNTPTWEDGYFIWQRTKTVGLDGTPTYSSPTCIQGAKGDTGKGISAIVEEYYLSNSSSSQTGGFWTTAQPAWQSGKYIWTRSYITWSDSTTSTTTPVLAKAINGANEAVDNLDNALDQTGVFNRLTNNGQLQGLYMSNGLLYINANYIRSGTLTVGGLNNTDGSISVHNASDVEVATLTNSGLMNQEISTYTHTQGWTMTLTTIARLSNAILSFTQHIRNNNTGTESTKDTFSAIPQYQVTESGSSANVATGMMFQPYQFLKIQSSLSDVPAYEYWAYQNSQGQPAARYLTTRGDYTHYGDFAVSNGVKARLVDSDEYGNRLLFCYETSSPMFGDVGDGTLDETGVCYIYLDPVFAETITNLNYQVFLQKYGEGDCYISERKPDHFVVCGEPGLSFGWEVKAKQKDFDFYRLEQNLINTPGSISYGMLGDNFYTELMEERI